MTKNQPILLGKSMRFLVYLLLYLIPISLAAQVADSLDIMDLLENYHFIEGQESELYWQLQELHRHPVDVNSASLKELLTIPFLTYNVAQHILKVRRRKGQFTNWNDVQKALGDESYFFPLLRPFLTLQKKQSTWHFELQNWGEGKYPLSRGYKNHQYGSPIRWLQKGRIIFGTHTQFFWEMEKDPGEHHFPDLFSFYLQTDKLPFQTRVLVGDYNIAFGRGLLLSTEYRSPVSNYAEVLFQTPLLRVRPKHSTNEWAFLRGVAINLPLGKNSELVPFVSHQLLDARSDTTQNPVAHLVTTGYHRTPTEQSHRRQLQESMAGLAFVKRSPRFSAGALFCYAHLNRRVLYRQRLHPQKYTSFSLVYQASWQNLHFNGEIAFSQASPPAWENSIIVRSKTIFYGLVVYNYSSFISPIHGRAFGSFNSLPSQKKGVFLYTTFPIFTHQHVRWYWYLHTFSHRQDSHQPFLPRFVLTYDGRYQKWQWSVQYHRLHAIIEADPESRQAVHFLRFHSRLKIHKHFILQQQMDWQWQDSRLNLRNPGGFAVYQDVSWSPLPQVHLRFRLTHFQTRKNLPPLYQFLPTLPGRFTTLGLSDRGYLWAVQFGWNIKSHYKIVFHLRRIQKPDELSIGSGLEQVNTNRLFYAGIYLSGNF